MPGPAAPPAGNLRAVLDALYSFVDGRALPGPLTVGPWSTDAQHGGPVAALLARTIEAVAAPVPMQVVRLTVELHRPVPLEPLDVAAEVTRPGRNVDVVDATLVCDGLLLARARALRIRVADVAVPPQAPSPPTPSDPLASTLRAPADAERRAFHLDAIELRYVTGSWDVGGPSVVWQRLRVPVVAGEEPSPLQRVAAAADSGNGISRVLSFDEYVFVNPDLTVALSRLPVGEWIGLDVLTRLSEAGWGQAESLLFDPIGPCGRAVQSLFVATR